MSQTTTPVPPIEITLNPPAVTLSPGDGAAEMVATVLNAGTAVDQYTLEISDLDPAWYTLDVPTVSLFPGESGRVRLRLHLPDEAAAGEHPFIVTARSSFNPTLSGAGRGLVQVEGPAPVAAMVAAESPAAIIAEPPAAPSPAPEPPLPTPVALPILTESAAAPHLATNGGSHGTNGDAPIEAAPAAPETPLVVEVFAPPMPPAVDTPAPDPVAEMAAPAAPAVEAPAADAAEAVAEPPTPVTASEPPPAPAVTKPAPPAAAVAEAPPVEMPPVVEAAPPPVADMPAPAVVPAPPQPAVAAAPAPAEAPVAVAPPPAPPAPAPVAPVAPAVAAPPPVVEAAAVEAPPVATPAPMAQAAPPPAPAAPPAPAPAPAVAAPPPPAPAPVAAAPPPPAPVAAAPPPPPVTSPIEVGLVPPPPPPARPRVEVRLNPPDPHMLAGSNPVEVTVQVRNLGTANDQFTVELTGLDASWYRMGDQTFSLFPGDSEPLTLRITVPAGTAPGDRRFAVEAASVFDTRVTARAEGVVRVDAPAPPPPPPETKPGRSARGRPAAPAAVQVSLDPEDVTVVPGGGPMHVNITVANPSTTIEDFTIEVPQLDTRWFSLSAPSLGVFPGDTATMRLTFAPPPDRPPRVGEYRYTVQVRGRSNTALAGEARAVVRMAAPVTMPIEGATAEAAMPARGPVPAPSPTPPRPAAPPPVAKATAAMPVMPTPPAVPADPVSVTLNPTKSRVLVGATPALVVATVRNMGSLPETFAITVEDLDAGWCTISAPLLALAPGASGQSAIKINPAPGAARPGPYAFTVRATPQSNSLASAVGRGLVDVRLPAIFTAELAPKRATGRRGRYEVRLANAGQGELQLQLSGEDAASRLNYRFKTTDAALLPGSQAVVPLTVRAKGLHIAGGETTYPFAVEARPFDGDAADLRTTPGEYVHQPRFKSWLAPILLLLLALLLIWWIPPWRPDLGGLPVIGSPLSGVGSAVSGLFGGSTAQPTPTAKFTFVGVFKTIHDSFPARIGDAAEKEWTDAAGNDHQLTTRGQLTWIKGVNGYYFSGPGPEGANGWWKFNIVNGQAVDVPAK